MIDLGNGRDRALASAAAGALFDGDRRRNAENRIHIGTRRGLDELPGVGVERFEIAALAFGEEDVERQRAFAAAADAGDDGELVARDADIDALEVVLARVVDADRMDWDLPRRAAPGDSAAVSTRGQSPQRCARMTSLALRDTLRGADADNFAARVAAFRPEIDDPIGSANDIEVVFDDDDRMTALDESVKRLQQRRDIVEMQPRGRLVKKKQRRVCFVVCARCAASFRRWASPPLSVGTGWPSFM